MIPPTQQTKQSSDVSVIQRRIWGREILRASRGKTFNFVTHDTLSKDILELNKPKH